MINIIETVALRLMATAFLCAFPSLTFATSEPKVIFPTSAQGWSELARQDIAAAYQITAENHPGTVDPHNPDFPKQLLQAKNHALALASQVSDAYGYEAVIDRFSASLRDGHAGAYATLPDTIPTIRRWPGFNAVWRGDALWVYHSEETGIQAGMQLITCDGKSIKSLMQDRVFAFAGQPDQPGHWWAYGSRLMLDDGNPFNPPLQQCQFLAADGNTVTRQLNWRNRPAAAMQYIEAAYNGDKLPIGLSWPQQQIAWIAMPTFQPEPQDVTLYETLFSTLKQQHATLLQAKAIVLDLRHNQGGSSYWSAQVAAELWGKAHVEARSEALFSQTEVWWFASPGNTAYVKSLYNVLQAQGQTSMLPWIQAVGQGMQKSLDTKQHFYMEKSDPNTQTKPKLPKDQPALKAPVYVIVPGQCASACLDALDVFRLFNNTILVGAPSSSDSTYMEVRTQPLPSGLGQVIIPNKFYVNRPRGHGQYYRPALTHNQLDWSTQALLEKILSDLMKTAKKESELSNRS
jgi:hypothetical protein